MYGHNGHVSQEVSATQDTTAKLETEKEMNFLAENCKVSNCFQQGFNHPTLQSEIVGLVVIAVVVMVIRKLKRR